MSLGRGLGALITPSSNRAPITKDNNTQDKIWNIPVSKISADPKQARKHFEPEALQEMAESIKTHGVLQPLLVSEKSDGGYELIAGERRLRAAKIAGLATVPVMVKKLAEQDKLEVALIENLQREDLNPIEEAFAYKRLMQEFNLTQGQVGEKVGKSRPAVANTIRLLDLPEAIQNALVEGKISSTQGRALLSLETDDQRLSMFSSMTGKKITTSELERTVSSMKVDKSKLHRDPNLAYMEDQLRSALGTKVNITQRNDKGTITIQYFSKEELKRLIKDLTE